MRGLHDGLVSLAISSIVSLPLMGVAISIAISAAISIDNSFGRTVISVGSLLFAAAMPIVAFTLTRKIVVRVSSGSINANTNEKAPSGSKAASIPKAGGVAGASYVGLKLLDQNSVDNAAPRAGRKIVSAGLERAAAGVATKHPVAAAVVGGARVVASTKTKGAANPPSPSTSSPPPPPIPPTPKPPRTPLFPPPPPKGEGES